MGRRRGASQPMRARVESSSSKPVTGLGSHGGSIRTFPQAQIPSRAWRPSLARSCRRTPARAMRRVQLRGGARWPHARRTRVRGVRARSGPRRRSSSADRLSRYVARRLMAPTKQMCPYHRSSYDRRVIEAVETVIVGGGQAGLALSYHLRRLAREHVVLEQGRLAERWRSERWDSLAFQFPSWSIRLPGYAYQTDDPEGFAPRDEVVRFLGLSRGHPRRSAWRARRGVTARPAGALLRRRQRRPRPPMSADPGLTGTGAFSGDDRHAVDPLSHSTAIAIRGRCRQALCLSCSGARRQMPRPRAAGRRVYFRSGSRAMTRLSGARHLLWLALIGPTNGRDRPPQSRANRS